MSVSWRRSRYSGYPITSQDSVKPAYTGISRSVDTERLRQHQYELEELEQRFNLAKQSHDGANKNLQTAVRQRETLMERKRELQKLKADRPTAEMRLNQKKQALRDLEDERVDFTDEERSTKKECAVS